jgi:peptide/nickel transport system substrate-binding protein
MRSVRYLSAVLALFMLATACGPGGQGAPKAVPSPIKGGSVTIAIWQEPASMMPIYSNQTITFLTSEVAIEGLVRPDPDGNYIPVLIKEVPSLKNNGVKVSTDGKKMDVTYHLLPNIKWADGQPLTSADIQYTWKLIITDKAVTTTEGYSKIESIDTPDDLTAVLHYKEVYAPFVTRFQSIYPKHALASIADVSKSDYARMPFGTGPFKFTENKSGDHLTAERNPNYRVAGKPYLDKIIFRSVPSREVAIAQLEAGEVDAMWNLLEAQVGEIEKRTDIKLYSVVGPSVERLEFNLAKPVNPADPKVPHPVLGEIAMRHALTLAVPKQRIIDKLLAGKPTPGNTPLSIGFFAPKDVKQDGYDPAKANQLLDQAGWTKGSDGIRSKGGVRAHLSISTTTGDKVREAVEVVLVDEFKQIGVELEVKNYPSSVLLGSWAANSPRNRGAYDITMYASSPDPDPHTTLSPRYTTAGIPTVQNNGAGFNYHRFSNPDVDKLIDHAGTTLDPDQRKKDYHDALKIMNDNYIGVWIYNRAILDAHRANLYGWSPNGWENFTWNVQDWYVKR